jgi:hypothetical protein
LIRRRIVAGLLLALLGNGSATAGDDKAIVKGGAVTGVAAVNVAAGNGNQQVNAGVISSSADLARALALIVQSTGDTRDSTGKLIATVAPDSFANSHGWIAINGTAGSGNQQANLAIIALGTNGAALSDTALSQARAPHEPTAGPETGAAAHERSVAIGGGAFANSSGLVQVNLIGGDRNSSANILTLSASAGVNQ